MKKGLSLLIIALMLGGSVSVFAAVSDFFSSINYSANFGLVTGSSSWAEASASTTDTDSNKLGFHAVAQGTYDINESFAANLVPISACSYSLSNTFGIKPDAIIAFCI